jgi:hypothetical protein
MHNKDNNINHSTNGNQPFRFVVYTKPIIEHQRQNPKIEHQRQNHEARKAINSPCYLIYKGKREGNNRTKLL